MSVRSIIRRRPIWIGALVAALTAAGSLAACNRSHHWGHRSSHEHTLEEAREHAQSHLKWALRAIDADGNQATKIRAITDNTVVGLYPLMRQHRDQHQVILDAFTAADIDRTELQRLRQQQLELLEAASTQIVDALADVSEILNDEQKAELREHMMKHVN